MSKAVLAGAAIAHKHYMPLIEYYDLNKGVKDPSAGLDSRSRSILTEIFDYTLTGWARILDRIAALAVVEIPICPLTFTTVMAAVDVPAAWVVGRIADATEQRAVKAIFEEYQSTGQVVKNLPPEIRTVASTKPPAPRVPDSRIKVFELPTQPEPIALTPVAKDSHQKDEPTALTTHLAPMTPILPITPTPPEPTETQPPAQPITSASSSRNTIGLDSDIVDAPSIGPKTAARFYQIGINTIGQFLATSAADMATQLNVSWVDASVLNDWQDQASLVIQVPALCGYKAQLLVGVNCCTAEELASLDIESLHAAIRKFCGTEAGARMIRSAPIPSQDEVGKWIQCAAQATARAVA